MCKNILTVLVGLAAVQSSSGYAFVGSSPRAQQLVRGSSVITTTSSPINRRSSSSSSRSNNGLFMVDQQVLMGAGIGVAGVVAGIGLVIFTEKAGERGGGLSESMSTKIAGSLMEDVEVSSVQDLGSLTSQLEQALKSSGGAKEDEFEMSEAEMKRIADEADDGW